MNLVMILICLIFLPHLVPDVDINLFGVSLLDWYGHVNLFCYRMMIPITGLSLLKYIPKSKIRYKSCLMCVFIYIIAEAVTGIIDPIVSYNVYSTLYLITGYSILAIFIMACVKQYSFKSDKIGKDNVYLCFHKPVTNRQFLASLIGLPFGGLCVYMDNHKYGFKLSKNTFQETRVKPEVMQRSFTIVDTGILRNDILRIELRKLIGTKAGKRITCIWTLRHVLAMLGQRFRPSWWSLFPPLYSIQVMS